MWLKKTTWLPLLFYPILVKLTSIFLLEIMLKTVIIVAKKTEKSRLSYDEVQENTLPLAKLTILMKINLVLLDDTVNDYLTWRNLQLNYMLHVVTLKDINSFIQMSWMNLFLTHFGVNANAILCNSERRCEKRTWWTFYCLFDAHLFSR